MKIMFTLAICLSLLAEEPALKSVQAELQAAREEIAHLKAQNAWCSTELNIWSQNPDIVQVRLTLMIESRKADERKKAEAKEKASQ